jgi:hypothetical protein
VPHRSQPLNPPTWSISPATTENRADQSLRTGAAFCARCNVINQYQPWADDRSISGFSHQPVVSPRIVPSVKSLLPGSAQNVECDVTHSKQTIGKLLPGSRIGQCRARTSIAKSLSNRERELLESSLTHRKQTVASRSNRELSTNPCRLISRVVIPIPTVLTETASQTEFTVTHSKQSADEILTGARIAHHGFRSAGVSPALLG